MKLHLGCGKDYWEGFTNVDLVLANKPDIWWDLNKTAPQTANSMLPDNCVEKMVALHLVEHLEDPLSVMERLYRIAAPGCLFYMAVPYGSSDDAWEDPTHLHPFFYNTPFYYSQAAYHRADYGYRGDWKMVRRYLMMAPHVPKDKNIAHNYLLTQRNCVKEMWIVLEAVKPARELPFTEAPPKTVFVFDNSTRSALLAEAKS